MNRESKTLILLAVFGAFALQAAQIVSLIRGKYHGKDIFMVLPLIMHGGSDLTDQGLRSMQIMMEFLIDGKKPEQKMMYIDSQILVRESIV